MPYPIPPWLTPPPNQEFFQHGADLGVRAATEKLQLQNQRAQMAQSAQMEMMRLSQAQDEANRRAMIQDQQLEIEKSYKQQMMDLQQQELANKQRVTDMQLQEAQRQQASTQRFQDLIQSGMEPDKAMLQAGPEAFGSPAGFAQAYRYLNQGAKIPEIVNIPGTGQKFVKLPSPEGFSFRPLNEKGQLSPDDKMFIRSLETEARALKSKMNNSAGALLAAKGDTSSPLVQEYLSDKQQLESIQSQIEEIYKGAGYQYPGGATAPPTAGTATLPAGIAQAPNSGLTVKFIRAAGE